MDDQSLGPLGRLHKKQEGSAISGTNLRDSTPPRCGCEGIVSIDEVK